MGFDPHLPADCQGNDPSFPWNQEDLSEAESLGSECCCATVRDGICMECKEHADEMFETDDQIRERESDEREAWLEAKAERQMEDREDRDNGY